MILLASASPRRKEILLNAGYDIKVVPADVEEIEFPEADKTVLHNALLKARKAAIDYPEDIIIAADTVVSSNNKILGKPKNLLEAKEMLLTLSGKSHEVFTGVAVIQEGEEINWLTTSKVCLKKLSIEDINLYFSLINPLDKAGAYNINEHSEIIIEKYEGSYTNIMGLPLSQVESFLKS